MDPALKKRWVEALRSGKYAQAREALRKYEGGEIAGYCCLGVLCDVIDPKGWDAEREDDVGDIYVFPHRLAMNDDESLDDDEAEHLGISVETMHALMKMNDGRLGWSHEKRDAVFIEPPKSFDEIATYIEENL